MASLQALPEEIVLHLTRYLPGKDIIHLSHTCQRFYSTLQSDFLWSSLFLRDKLIKKSEISEYSLAISKDCNFKGSIEKIDYIQHKRVRDNWRHCRYQLLSKECNPNFQIGYDGKDLVEVERHGQNSWSIAHYDLKSKDAQCVKMSDTFPLNFVNQEMSIYYVELSTIFVSKSTAILMCFQRRDEESGSLQLIAYDLKNDLAESWTHFVPEWGQFQLIRVFEGDMYVFNLPQNTIKVHDIRTYDLKVSLAIGDEMKLPNGEVTGDGIFLAVPGKMVQDNAPAICTWNVQNNTYTILRPTSSFCPFRWFEKVVVSQGKVYGLLNRRCLIVWNAQDPEPLVQLDLTQSYPGQTEMFGPIFTYLSVCGNSLATFNESPCVQTVYEMKVNPDSGQVELVPKMPKIDLRKILKSNTRICDVKLTDLFVVLHVLNVDAEMFEVIIIPIDVIEEELEETVINSRIVDGSYRIEEEMSRILVTPTKLLYLTSNQIRIYDFL